jgi:aspartyl protease family protein
MASFDVPLLDFVSLNYFLPEMGDCNTARRKRLNLRCLMRKITRRNQKINEAPVPQKRATKGRLWILAFLLVPAVGAVFAYKDPKRAAVTKDTVSDSWRQREPTFGVQIPRSSSGEFAVQTRINGVAAPMVVDTGATSVVLTYETAKAVGIPLELLEYNIDVQTASGHTKAARLWIDRLTIGRLVERSVPALVVPHGMMKTNLLGMSFLDRLDGFEMRADQLMLRGFQEPVTLPSGYRSFVLK